MDILLIIAAIVSLLALLGFTGLIKVLKGAAWLILVIGLIILAVAFLF